MQAIRVTKHIAKFVIMTSHTWGKGHKGQGNPASKTLSQRLYRALYDTNGLSLALVRDAHVRSSPLVLPDELCSVHLKPRNKTFVGLDLAGMVVKRSAFTTCASYCFAFASSKVSLTIGDRGRVVALHRYPMPTSVPFGP